jgi:hypothetical protein
MRAPADLVLLAAAVLDLMPPAVAVLDLVSYLALDLACYRERERQKWWGAVSEQKNESGVGNG